VEIVVAPNTNSIKGGILIEFATNLGRGSRGVLVGMILNKSLKLLATTTRVIGTFYMTFTNPIMIIRVTKTILTTNELNTC
jgi:hypothetical protein